MVVGVVAVVDGVALGEGVLADAVALAAQVGAFECVAVGVPSDARPHRLVVLDEPAPCELLWQSGASGAKEEATLKDLQGWGMDGWMDGCGCVCVCVCVPCRPPRPPRPPRPLHSTSWNVKLVLQGNPKSTQRRRSERHTGAGRSKLPCGLQSTRPVSTRVGEEEETCGIGIRSAGDIT